MKVNLVRITKICNNVVDTNVSLRSYCSISMHEMKVTIVGNFITALYLVNDINQHLPNSC